MKILRKNLSLLILFFIHNIYAQDTTTKYLSTSPAIPVSWTSIDTARIAINNYPSFRTSLNSYMLPAFDNSLLKAKADSIDSTCTSCPQINHYGYGIRNTIDIKASAQYYNDSIAGGKLWIMRITSPTAIGFQFYFSNFSIPANSALFIYTADRSQLLGPYNSGNVLIDSTKAIQFGTVPILSNDVYLEYFESDSADYVGNLRLDNIIHMYGTLTSANDVTTGQFGASDQACQQDICTQPDYLNAASTVALIIMYDDNTNLTGTCTGTLLNNTDPTKVGTPYFLTAAHCLLDASNSRIYDLSTWVFIFDWQFSDCSVGNSTPPTYNTIVWGATALSVDAICTGTEDAEHSDYALLQLTNGTTPVCSLNVAYAGWIYYDVFSPPAGQEAFGASSKVTLIHHPKGDVKKISQGDNLRSASGTSSAYDCVNSSTDLSGVNYFNLDLNTFGGGLEPGSSGGPIFVGPEPYGIGPRVIGTANALKANIGKVYDPCNQSTYTGYYGKFSTSWTLGSFQQWLDPQNKALNPLNSGGTDAYYPLNYNTSSNTIASDQGAGNGIKVNGKSGLPGDGIAVICPAGNMLTIEPLIADAIDMYIYQDRVSTSAANFCPELSTNVNILGITVSSKHYNNYLNYQIYIDLFDNNFNVVQSWTKIYSPEACSGEVSYSNGDGVNWIGSNVVLYGGSEPTESGNGWNVVGASKIMINTSDLGFNLIPGRYYNIGIATNYPGLNPVWNYSSRYIYILPTDLTVNNPVSYVSDNLYASNTITLDNVTVPSSTGVGPSVEAATLITLSSTSNIQSGHYYIEDINCSSFRLADPNGGNSGNQNGLSTTGTVKNQNMTTSLNNQLISGNSNKNQPAISIYPNPTNNNITVDFSSSLLATNNITFNVYNTTGQIVKNQNTPINTGSQFNIDLNDLSPGMYNVIVNQGSKIWQKKIIKQ